MEIVVLLEFKFRAMHDAKKSAVRHTCARLQLYCAVLQDPYGRTALHVAATSNALEVVSMMCKVKSIDINPVDGYGCTPLDNARMTRSAPIAALLERAGAKPGRDESLVSKAQEVKEWVGRNARSQQQLHLDTVQTKFPEQEQAAHAATAVQHQTEFVHVCFKFMRS